MILMDTSNHKANLLYKFSNEDASNLRFVITKLTEESSLLPDYALSILYIPARKF